MKNTHKRSPMEAKKSGGLKGLATPPGDKSISHRAVMLGGIACGTTIVRGLLEGEDVMRTIAALTVLGATITRDNDVWRIDGCGESGPSEADNVIDMGNSGTAVRLLTGLLGTRPFTTFFTGDASLRQRPMKRVMDPLERMGSGFVCRSGGRLPLAVTGASTPTAITYRLPVASAQVKSAVLLAGLNANGTTTVIEATPTRDHSERMLAYFGADIRVESSSDGTEAISIKGFPTLTGREIVVPADISSAAFPLVAALLYPQSEITLINVGLNPRRDGIVRTLREMGADISFSNSRNASGESVADIKVKTSCLKGIEVPPDRAPSMIDEFPVLAVAAACAEGETRMRGLAELRVKESDRLDLMAKGLKACGADVGIEGDDLIVRGNGRPPRGGATIATAMDHRIAMSFLVLGGITDEPVRVDDGTIITTSFPGFAEMMNRLGANIV